MVVGTCTSLYVMDRGQILAHVHVINTFAFSPTPKTIQHVLRPHMSLPLVLRLAQAYVFFLHLHIFKKRHGLMRTERKLCRADFLEMASYHTSMLVLNRYQAALINP